MLVTFRYSYFQNWADEQKWLTVIFSMDRPELHFTFDQEWKANYELEITFDAGKERLGGDFWQRALEGTLSTYYDSVKVLIPDGAQSFKIKVIVPEIGKIFEDHQKVNPEKILDGIRFSINRAPFGKYIYHLYDTLMIRFNVRYPIDSLVYRVTAKKKVIYQQVIHDVAVGSDTITIVFENLSEGGYEHRFLAFGESDEEDIVEFYLQIPFYYSDDKYNERVEQLRYIAAPAELKKLKRVKNPKERLTAYNEFWSKRDPTPGTELNELREEYLSRIAYSEENFKRGDLGWRSDRGKVYVKFGPPDEIESHPFEAETRAYEIWVYYGKNRKFTFVDRYGFGRYELLYPEGVQI